jgi:hypothetical protein
MIPAQFRSLARWPVPHYGRPALYMQGLVVIAGAFVLQWWPSVPGLAIGLLGFAAATMALEHLTKPERAIWIAIIFALFVLESHSIIQDRNEHDKQQAQATEQEEQNFKVIANEITEAMRRSDRNFEQTMMRSDRIIAEVGESIKTETGGDSFAFVSFFPEPNERFAVIITSHGRYPLRQINVDVSDEERRTQALQEYIKHPEGDIESAIRTANTYYQVPFLRPQSPELPMGQVQMLDTYPFGTEDARNFTIAFSSFNGYWNERLHLRRINGKWYQALSVVGPTAKQTLHPFIYFDPNFPEGKALAEKDWQRIKPQPRHP